MADSIKLGNLDISAFKVGSDDCKVYLGDTLLYPTTPPVFEGKYKLTLSDSSTVSAECDGTSAVTSGEVASQYSGSVVSAEIGNCVTSIGDRVFYNCTSLTSITIGNSVTSIGQWAFNKCSGLTSITLPDSVTSIDEWAFYGCSNLTSIDFPDNVTTIGKSIMRGCNSLSTVTIGSGITSIGASVFFNCTGLTSVTIEATTPPSIGVLVFENTNDCPIYVPSGSVSAYQSAWSEYEYSSRIQAIPNS